MPAIPKTVRSALEHVLDYLWDDEKKDFEGYRDDNTNEMSPEADDHASVTSKLSRTGSTTTTMVLMTSGLNLPTDHLELAA